MFVALHTTGGALQPTYATLHCWVQLGTADDPLPGSLQRQQLAQHLRHLSRTLLRV